MAKPTIVTKITVRLMGAVSAIREMEDGPIMRVFGIIHGLKHGANTRTGTDGTPQSQPWTALIGQFQAINLRNGAEFVSAKCFVPGAGGEMIIETFKAAQAGENPVESMKFAMDIAKVKAETATGYTYQCTPIIMAQENNPLLDLQREMATAIEAPPEPAPEKATEKKKK